jgi:hypothetical protein
VGAGCAVVVALTGVAFAQAPGQLKKETRAPNQAVETGHHDDAVVEVGGQQVHIDPQTGEMREPTPAEAAALGAALEAQFGKRADGTTVTYLPNGTVAAQLGDSFMEAIAVTRGADGSLTFSHTSASGASVVAAEPQTSTAVTKTGDERTTPAAAPEPLTSKPAGFVETE